ncbi:hypothetical protein G6735_07895 [Polynucleobacter paneuropaeus]|nr:hypothetical protein [Polynucleobacter paneuropaeus]
MLILGCLVLVASCSFKHEDKFYISACDPKDSNCIDKEAIITSYRVDIKANKVLSIIRMPHNDTYQSSVIWDKEYCEIFDEKNWDCKADGPFNIRAWENKMVDGNLVLATSFRNGKTQFFYVKKLGYFD